MEEEVELKSIVLEDGLEYYIIDEINSFVYLSNINDHKDMCIRKDIGEEIIGLKDEEEFMLALNLYKEKHSK